ncbi:MAG: hypothetical protein ACREN8_12575 [Candidatus Dormibacteraceae bacterium]
MSLIAGPTDDVELEWETMGVDENIIAASWQALVEAVAYGLMRSERPSGVRLSPAQSYLVEAITDPPD